VPDLMKISQNTLSVPKIFGIKKKYAVKIYSDLIGFELVR
jgi:hypothetical protein